MLRMQWNGADRCATPMTGKQLRQQHLFRSVCPPTIPAYKPLYSSASPIPSLAFPPAHEVLLEQQQDMSLKSDSGTLYLTTFRLVFVPYACVTDRGGAVGSTEGSSRTHYNHDGSAAGGDAADGGASVNSHRHSNRHSSEKTPRRSRPHIFAVPIAAIAHCSMPDSATGHFGLELVCKDARNLKFGVSDAIQSVLTAASKSDVTLHIQRVLAQICEEVRWRCAERAFGFSMVDTVLASVRINAVKAYNIAATSNREEAEAAEAAVASHNNGSEAKAAALSLPHGAPHNFRRKIVRADATSSVLFERQLAHVTYSMPAAAIGWRLLEEYARLGVAKGHPNWVATNANASYGLCETYPRHLIVPRAFPAEQLHKAAKLRSKQRLPALTWIHPTNGAPLCRCAQPNSGLHITKLTEDNEMLHAIRTANNRHTAGRGRSNGGNGDGHSSSSAGYGDGDGDGGGSCSGGGRAEVDGGDEAGPGYSVPSQLPERDAVHEQEDSNGWRARARRNAGPDGYKFGDVARFAIATISGSGGGSSGNTGSGGVGGGAEGDEQQPVLHIYDARPYLNAGANALKGKGYESIADLGGPSVASIIFCDIGNIHVMRQSLQSLVAACSENADAPDFWGQVAASKWLEHVGRVLQGSRRMAATLERGHPCIVHCSDGWDRTSQLSATARGRNKQTALATKNLLEDTDGLPSRCGSPLLSADVRSSDDVIAF